MSGKPFDGTFKDLVEVSPLAWAEWLCPGPVSSAELVDADLSTVSAAVDKVLRVQRPTGDLLLSVSAESGHSGHAPEQALFYATLLRHRHGLPVKSVLVLLRREANASNVTGQLELRTNETDAEPYLLFRYEVVRVWQQPLEAVLTGPVALLPFAPLTDEAAGESLEATMVRVVERLEAETTGELAVKLEAAALVLMGLRYPPEIVLSFLNRNTRMRESSLVQGLLAEGEARGIGIGAETEARTTLLRLGRHKLGEPSVAVLQAVKSISDLNRLRELLDRILDVTSWDELLAE